jgi:hypothetical protein
MARVGLIALLVVAGAPLAALDHQLNALGAADEVTVESVCVDRRREWSRVGDV